MDEENSGFETKPVCGQAGAGSGPLWQRLGMDACIEQRRGRSRMEHAQARGGSWREFCVQKEVPSTAVSLV